MKQYLIISALIFLLLVAGCARQHGLKTEQQFLAEEQVNKFSIIPQPEKLKSHSGEFVFNQQTQLVVLANEPEVQMVVDFLQQLFKMSAGFELSQTSANFTSEMKNVVVLKLDKKFEKLGNEGYSLRVKPEVIELSAFSAAGLFYGVQTLRQLLPPQFESLSVVNNVNWIVPGVEIEDVPRFQWRGMHLDVCRHFFPKEFIKKYIDILAMHKINTFHWHLTEDQGWRIEIKKYPKLTEVGAWRADREGTTWRERQPQQPGEAATYGGFYTLEEVKEIVAYAKTRFIDIVPEIEMPGHALAALASYPEYSCFGGPFTVATGGYWPIVDIYCAGKDATFEFLENILDEVIPLFPSKFFHIGGDEANKEKWLQCPDCQKRIQDEGLKDVNELQSYFVKRIEKFLNSRGKRLIGWDEILEGGLAPNAAVMSWRGVDGGIAAANAGHDVVMSPTSHCYFDYYQAQEGEPDGIGGFLPLEKVYSLEPTPPDINKERKHHILGAQANMWSEYLPNPDHVEYMLLPRLAALSEVVWSPKDKRNFNDFQRRLQKHYKRLSAGQINYRVPTPIGCGGETVFFDKTQLTLKNPLHDAEIHFTVDGTEPTLESQKYVAPVEIVGNAIVKARTFTSDGKLSSVATQNFFLLDKEKNGMSYKYYEGKWEMLPEFQKLKTVKQGRIYSFDLSQAREKEEFYGFVLTGFLKIDQAGEYTFFLISDDGSRMLLDDQSIVENDGTHGANEESGSVNLESGLHKMTIEYFDFAGPYALDLWYQRSGFEKQRVPLNLIFVSR